MWGAGGVGAGGNRAESGRWVGKQWAVGGVFGFCAWVGSGRDGVVTDTVGGVSGGGLGVRRAHQRGWTGEGLGGGYFVGVCMLKVKVPCLVEGVIDYGGLGGDYCKYGGG